MVTVALLLNTLAQQWERGIVTQLRSDTEPHETTITETQCCTTSSEAIVGKHMSHEGMLAYIVSLLPVSLSSFLCQILMRRNQIDKQVNTTLVHLNLHSLPNPIYIHDLKHKDIH